MSDDDEPTEEVKTKACHVPVYLSIPGSFSDADLEELIRRFKETAGGRTLYLPSVQDDPPSWVAGYEVDEYPLCTPEGDFTGGVWCADDACPCAAENSEIGEFREGEFTVTELRHAISDHLIKRARNA